MSQVSVGGLAAGMADNVVDVVDVVVGVVVWDDVRGRWFAWPRHRIHADSA